MAGAYAISKRVVRSIASAIPPLRRLIRERNELRQEAKALKQIVLGHEATKKLFLKQYQEQKRARARAAKPRIGGSAVQEALVADVSTRFGLSVPFTRAFLDMWGEYCRGYEDWESLEAALDPLHRMYIVFGLSTRKRGEEVYARIEASIAAAGNAGRTGRRLRVIDIGCGQGGFLRAFAAHGYEGVGVELLPHLAEQSRLNLSDLDPRPDVFNEDVLDIDSERLGRFDVSLCNDVIEHVADAARLMEQLGKLTAPGGQLYMVIPNANALSFVKSDGHYQMFGITLLPHDRAEQYHRQVMSDPYGVGEYYPLDFYLDGLDRAGFDVEIQEHHASGKFEDVPLILKELGEAFVSWRKSNAARLDAATAGEVTDRYLAYMEAAHRDYRAALHSPELESAFRLRYLCTFWNLLGRRRGQRHEALSAG